MSAHFEGRNFALAIVNAHNEFGGPFRLLDVNLFVRDALLFQEPFRRAAIATPRRRIHFDACHALLKPLPEKIIFVIVLGPGRVHQAVLKTEGLSGRDNPLGLRCVSMSAVL